MVSNMAEIKNVVFVDFLVDKSWSFTKSLEKNTELKWIGKGWNNSGNQKNKFDVLKRYVLYFWYAFVIFINRRKYDRIVAWQQFYGLLFALYCSLFRVKKINKLIIMTFIFKERQGKFASLYKAMINRIVRSEYVDKFVVFSKNEVEYYSQLFGVDKSKFCYSPLGIEDKPEIKDGIEANDLFFLSVGRSNRDYEFLVDALNGTDYNVVILTDMPPKVENLSSNIKIFTNVEGYNYLRFLDKCYGVIIPLKDKNISSGQLVMLRAMQFKKPVVITESNTLSDYIVDNENGIVINKNKQDLFLALDKLLQDKKLYNRLAEQGYSVYEQSFSLYALAKNIGKIAK